MYGSTDMTVFRTSTCPCSGAANSPSTSSTSASGGSPAGRCRRRHSREVRFTMELVVVGQLDRLLRAVRGCLSRGGELCLRNVDDNAPHGHVPVVVVAEQVGRGRVAAPVAHAADGVGGELHRGTSHASGRLSSVNMETPP